MFDPKILTVRLETGSGSYATVALAGNRSPVLPSGVKQFPMKKSAITASPESLLDFVASRILHVFNTDDSINHDCVVISLPGTVSLDSMTVIRSTRLGILEPLNFADFFESRHGLRVRLLRDAPASLVGELHLHEDPPDWRALTIALLIVDEGVGAAIMIGGQVQMGSGVAGEVGRLTIDPAGPYSPTFYAHGSLEGYVARRAIVARLMEDYRKAVRDPRGPETQPQYEPLWKALEHIVDPVELPLKLLVEAVDRHDPIAMPVFEDTARFLGLGISHLITVTAPHHLVLGGSIARLPGLYQRTLAYARRYTWGLAWNSRRTQLASDLVSAQHAGSAIIAQALGWVDSQTD